MLHISSCTAYHSTFCDPPVEFAPIHYQEVVFGLQDAALDGDRASRVHIVTGHHAHRDTGTLAVCDGRWHLESAKFTTLILHLHENLLVCENYVFIVSCKH